MPDPNFRIYPDWKDTLVYDEGDGRTLRLDCDCVEPYQVSVPSADRWLDQTPPWAHERREIVLERLRTAKCIICEESQFTRTIHAPDGTCHVESYYEMDERGHPIRWIRIIGTDRDVVLDLNEAGLDGGVGFPGTGIVTLPFNLRGRHRQIGINVRDRTFWCHPADEPQSLDRLPVIFAEPAPRVVDNPLIRPRWRSILGSLGLIAASLLFVAAGIWQSIAGRTPRDHWIGAICAIFFGLCAAAGIADLRRWIKPRRRI